MKSINFKKVVLFFLLFLFSPFFNINAADQKDVKEGFYVIESLVGENKSVDVDSASTREKANVWLWEKNNSIAQIFYIRAKNNGFYEIQAVCSGMALDVEYGKKEAGTNVWQYTVNSTDAQMWQFEHCYDDVFKIKSKLGDFYLDVWCARSESGTNIGIWPPNNTSAQKFRMKKVDVEKYGIFGDTEQFGFLNFKMDYSKKILKLKDYIFDYYSSKEYKNVLVLGDKEFLKNFNDVFKSQNNFHFELEEFLHNVKNESEYDLIINEKYNSKFLKLLFPQNNIETFQEVYAGLLYKATISYLNKNEIPVYFFDAPRAHEMKNLDWIRNHTVMHGFSELNLYKRQDLLDKIFGNNEDCKNYFISKEFNESFNIIKVKDHFAIADFKGKYCNIIDHHRFIKWAPENSKNTIYMFGPCTMRSKYVPDNYTIESIIQKNLNEDFGGKYRCVGYGVESPEINDFEYILDTDFKPGDIVIVEREFSEGLKRIINQNNCHYSSLSAVLGNQKLGFSIGSDFTHLNHIGCQAVANFMYETIEEKLKEFSNRNFENKIITFGNNSGGDQFIKDNPDFTAYLENLKLISKPYREEGKKIGSLNVNCNPFTKGHRYLIEESLKRVDHLFLFVVEEDASEFSFKDRYEMVKRGIADLKNITLLTTGKWMCSKFTFPDYFDKDALQSKIILNPTKDIELYGKYIAPALGATLRFAGEEPLDLITRQHNNFMKEKLPNYGVTFCEIPRKTLENGQVISASRVRKCLKEKNFKELETLVPKTTYDYLLEKFT